MTPNKKEIEHEEHEEHEALQFKILEGKHCTVIFVGAEVGFLKLIQKEWCSFGHRFRTRLASSCYALKRMHVQETVLLKGVKRSTTLFFSSVVMRCLSLETRKILELLWPLWFCQDWWCTNQRIQPSDRSMVGVRDKLRKITKNERVLINLFLGCLSIWRLHVNSEMCVFCL